MKDVLLDARETLCERVGLNEAVWRWTISIEFTAKGEIEVDDRGESTQYLYEKSIKVAD